MDILEVKIDEAFSRRDEKPRDYIGASTIGHPCDAYLSLCLRGFPDNDFAPSLLRIFRDGHRIEDIVIADLKAAGYHVQERDPLTNRQWAYTARHGHVRANADGQIWRGETLMLLEIKSMNDANWRSFVKEGVKKSHQKYYEQMQMLMGMSGMTQCTFVSYNKNNSRYHSEIVDFDPFVFSYQQERIDHAMRGSAFKVGADETDWRCRACFKSEVCWKGRLPEVACKTCAYATPDEFDGGWFCEKHKRPAEVTCEEYQVFKPKERPKK